MASPSRDPTSSGRSGSCNMSKQQLRILLLALLVAGSLLTAASPAWASNVRFDPSEYEVAEAAGYVLVLALKL